MKEPTPSPTEVTTAQQASDDRGLDWRGGAEYASASSVEPGTKPQTVGTGVRYHLIKVSLVFPYEGVRLEIGHDPRVPADVVLSDPAPPVEEEGRTRHYCYWSPQDCRWDEQRSITQIRDVIESQGHVVDDILLAVLRTSGQASEEQLAHDRMWSATTRPFSGDDVDVLR